MGRQAIREYKDSQAPRTAVLVNNPNLFASPKEVARVVAGLPTPNVLQVAEGEDILRARTSGRLTTHQVPCNAIPRNLPEFDLSLNEFSAALTTQLTKHGWKVSALQHTEAVEERVLQIQSPGILQFATHGMFLDCPRSNSTVGWDNPLMRSVLFLAGSNRRDPAQSTFYKLNKELISEADARKHPELKRNSQRVDLADGLLTAYDVTGMNLQGTELVNLTACETGLGEVTADGIVGLRHAFLLAGAHALTMSMWEVPTAETTEQIRDFYTAWLDGPKKNQQKAISRYQAFRSSQLAALDRSRNGNNKKTRGISHPFYWAGIVYVGNPGDLPPVSPSLASPKEQFSADLPDG